MKSYDCSVMWDNHAAHVAQWVLINFYMLHVYLPMQQNAHIYLSNFFGLCPKTLGFPLKVRVNMLLHVHQDSPIYYNICCILEKPSLSESYLKKLINHLSQPDLNHPGWQLWEKEHAFAVSVHYHHLVCCQSFALMSSYVNLHDLNIIDLF